MSVLNNPIDSTQIAYIYFQLTRLIAYYTVYIINKSARCKVHLTIYINNQSYQKVKGLE